MSRAEIIGYHRIHTAIWRDPEFTKLSPAAQLVYFYARCRDGRTKFDLDEARSCGLSTTSEEYSDAVADLRTSTYARVLDGRCRRSIPSSVRRAVIERDERCQACGTTENLSLDHIIPYSLGGADTEDNLQVLCRPCNSRKGAKLE